LTLHRNNGARPGDDPSDPAVIVDGSVLIRNGIIHAVGPTRRVENMAEARKAEEIDATGRVVMPALIDPHACIVPVPGYRRQSEKAVQDLPATRLEAQADDLLKTMASHGTATVGALSGHGSNASGELKILRALHAKDRKPLDITSILRIAGGEESDEVRLELLHCAARRKLAHILAVQCGDGGVQRTAAESLFEAARELGLPVRLELSLGYPSDVVERAVNLGALSISVAGTYRAVEVEHLAGSATVAIVLPLLLAKRGSHGSARELLDNGAPVALGSGIGPAEDSTASMQTVIQHACDHCGMSLHEAISGATINAARALGAGSLTGSLEGGKLADMILLNASDYREVRFLGGTNLTHLMIKRGVVLFKEEFPGWPKPS